jgi:hypothetical protein
VPESTQYAAPFISGHRAQLPVEIAIMLRSGRKTFQTSPVSAQFTKQLEGYFKVIRAPLTAMLA